MAGREEDREAVLRKINIKLRRRKCISVVVVELKFHGLLVLKLN